MERPRKEKGTCDASVAADSGTASWSANLPEAAQEEVLIFVFVENKIPLESISVSNAMIPDDGGLTLRFPTCPLVQGACRDEHHGTAG
jgi:hypothetical protein